jgi:nicotinamide mononucleotide (NMN) deamidase PncC
MAADSEAFVRQIHAGGRPFVLALTGGGSAAAAALLGVPGASASVLEVLVPYSQPALERFLGGKPDHYCTPQTARAMAMAAYRRASEYQPGRDDLAGIALTASLATDRPKRGAHRLHAAYQTASTTTAVSVELVKGRRSRQQEESVAAAVVLSLVAEACGLAERLPVDLSAEERLERAVKQAPAAWQELLAGKIERVGCQAAAGEPTKVAAATGPLVFPGAFNPLHDGHRRMAAAAERLAGRRPLFEISISNVDKPLLDFLEIDRRVQQFEPGDAVWLTRAATFVEKARLFPGATFIVGADTIRRIAEAKYYAGGVAGLVEALEAIANQGCRFLVFGRLIDGAFRTLSDLALPAALMSICAAVPEESFRADISSTVLRTPQRE